LSKEEDEKLLYCSKILPNQWRSIAPIVERTASQCLERYEQLISEAHLNQEYTLTTNKQRVVKAKEFDIDPESRPAKPA
jgi:pre-mRNA-splicing factor CDC5/CEF1